MIQYKIITAWSPEDLSKQLNALAAKTTVKLIDGPRCVVDMQQNSNEYMQACLIGLDRVNTGFIL